MPINMTTTPIREFAYTFNFVSFFILNFKFRLSSEAFYNYASSEKGKPYDRQKVNY